MPSNAFEGQVHPVPDRPVESAGTIDRLHAIDPVGRENHHAADGVANGHELVILRRGKLRRDFFHRLPPYESLHD